RVEPDSPPYEPHLGNWWRRRELPPGPLRLFRVAFIAIVDRRRQPQYRGRARPLKGVANPGRPPVHATRTARSHVDPARVMVYDRAPRTTSRSIVPSAARGKRRPVRTRRRATSRPRKE